MTLSSVFSFSSSHSLSELPSDVHRGGSGGPGKENDDAALVLTSGLGGMTDTTTGDNLGPASSRAPFPASSLHCTFLVPLMGFFSLSDTLLYGCDAILERSDLRGERSGWREFIDADKFTPEDDDRLE